MLLFVRILVTLLSNATFYVRIPTTLQFPLMFSFSDDWPERKKTESYRIYNCAFTVCELLLEVCLLSWNLQTCFTLTGLIYCSVINSVFCRRLGAQDAAQMILSSLQLAGPSSSSSSSAELPPSSALNLPPIAKICIPEFEDLQGVYVSVESLISYVINQVAQRVCGI